MVRRGTGGIVGGAAAALIVAAVVATQLAGKGGPPLAEAGEQLDGQSLRVRVTNEQRAHGVDGVIRSTGEGVMTPTGETGHIVVTSVAPNEPETTEEVIYRPGEEWIRTKDRARPLPRGKDWVHWTREDGGPSGIIPSDYGRLLTLAEEVEEVGADHYKAVVDVRRLGLGDGPTTEQRIKLLFSPRVKRQPIEVWLHEDGRPRRLRLRLRTVSGSEMNFDVELLEIGVDADPEPPPTETVVEGDALLLENN